MRETRPWLLDDGSLIISTKVGHINQVLPIVRYWIPHVRIISPHDLQHNLNTELANYINIPHRGT
ncbi:MAG: hypothetical protein AUJ57_08055 [Zetaproteobacteria bacterium CG1_02_53_45]|nr:MAG: hypothetical protein AUJ57_08055 [Zetaproteobacteria bacterium CG1_02_53_45]